MLLLWLLIRHLFVLIILISIVSPENIYRRKEILGNNFMLNITMPDVKPEMPDSYICTAKKLDPHESYIVQFLPLADMRHTHHMVLFGCSDIQNENHLFPGYWDCNRGLCEKVTIMYAWAKNAPPTNLPKDVGFRVGANTPIRYLVLQLHYANPLPGKTTDNSGISLHMTRTPQKYVAGIYLLLANSGEILPHKPKFHVDVNCIYHGKEPIYTFAYRVHSHKMGTVITGYKYDMQSHRWTLLAKGNPQWPQAFFPVKETHTIKNKDVLAARCTYNSTDMDSSTYIGSSANDEMCNLYIMYYTSSKKGQMFSRCMDVSLPSLVNELPLGSDSPLPSYNILEEYVHDNPQSENSFPYGKPDIFLDKKLYHALPVASEVVAQSHSTHTSDYNDLSANLDSQYSYVQIDDWPQKNIKFGQVAAVSIDKNGAVYVFHRGDHVWNSLTFDKFERYELTDQGPISVHPIVKLDPSTGFILHEWGSNLFYIPHGLTVDNEYVWLTDVALHQVFKFPIQGSVQPLMALGERFTPGSNKNQFCKPTSVAASSKGDFYVADGYCNSRIIRFSSEGKYLNEWGLSDPVSYSPPPGTFNIPHKVILAEERNLVCVADRENGRIQCLTMVTGDFSFQIARKDFGGKLFSIAYTPFKGGILYAVSGEAILSEYKPKSFAFNISNQNLLSIFAPKSGGFSQPHDIAVTEDSDDVFVCELHPMKVWKFSRTFHKSAKKVLSEQPTMSTTQSHVSELGHETTESIENIKNFTKIQHKSFSLISSRKDSSNFGTSLIVMAFLAIPVLILILVTVVIRLRKRGKFQQCSVGHFKGWLGGYRSPAPQDKFNLGRLLNPHKGFDRVALGESDCDGEEGSDSDVEEYNAISRKA